MPKWQENWPSTTFFGVRFCSSGEPTSSMAVSARPTRIDLIRSSTRLWRERSWMMPSTAACMARQAG
ncbi:hypothetical protein D3C83_70810 [compost metagenome]